MHLKYKLKLSHGAATAVTAVTVTKIIADLLLIRMCTLKSLKSLAAYAVPSDLPRAQARFGANLDSTNIKEQDDVYFECHVNANPHVARLQWYKNVSFP